MAEMDPRQIAQSGVDPVTGFPLSKEVRKALFKRATVSSSIFDKGGPLAIRPRDDIINRRQDELIIRNTQTDNSLQQQIDSLKQEVFVLSSGLAAISNLIQNEGAAERSRLLQEQETERREQESKIRIGRESQLERVIQAAVLAPVQAIQPKIENIFSRVGSALSTLFLGWLGSQGLKTIKAYSEGNIEKLKEIKDSVLRNIGVAIAGLAAIKTGFSLVTSAVKSVTFKLISLIAKGIALPFKAAGALARGIGGGGFKMPGLRMPRLPGLGAIGKGLGRLFTPISLGISAYRFSQGDIVGGALSAASAVPVIGLPAIGLDVAREFGMFEGTFLGKNESQKAESSRPSTTPSQTKTPPAPSINRQSKSQQLAAKPATTPSKQTSSTPVKPAPQAPPKSQPSVASPILQTPTNSLSPTVNFNIDSQDKLSSSSESLSQSPFGFEEPSTTNISDMKSPEISQSDTNMTPEILTPNQIQVPIKQSPQVSQTPEPKPNIIYRRIGEQQSPPPTSSANGPLTDVPLIKSSNPDNFYVLYSQLQYNVVI